MTLRRCAVEMRAFRESVTAAHVPFPPLAKASHGSVVQCHLGIQAPNAPSSGAQPHAELGLLTCDEGLAIAAGSLERRGSHHHVTAACAGFAHRPIPFPIAKSVVDRPIWTSLPTAPEHGC